MPPHTHRRSSPARIARAGGTLVVTALLACCSGASSNAAKSGETETGPAAERPTGAQPAPSEPESLAAAFGIEGATSSCSRFFVFGIAGDQRSALRVRVDMDGLGLGAGTHRLDIAAAPVTDGRPAVEVEVMQYDGELSGEPFCNDIAEPQPSITSRWTAVAGHLEVTVHETVGDSGRFDVDVTLDDVELHDPAGNTKVVRAQFDGLLVGWFPG